MHMETDQEGQFERIMIGNMQVQKYKLVVYYSCWDESTHFFTEEICPRECYVR